MKIELSYGNGFVSFNIPRENIAQIIQPGKTQSKLSDDKINVELSQTAAAKEFAKIIKNKKLCVLVPDGTRDLPTGPVLETMTEILRGAGKIRFVICSGTHNAETEQNEAISKQICGLMKKNDIENFDIIAHDCEKADFINAGQTRRKTEVLYNAAISEMEVFLALSDVKHHYFAGYSNPVKNFVPGICAYKTAQGNHSLSLDDRSRFGTHPWHNNKQLQDNPLAQDQVEAMEKILNNRPFWAVTMISTKGQIQWLRLAKAKEAAANAFDKADEWNIHKTGKVERMIISCGGMPNDIDLYIAQRGLELTKQAIKKNGQILFVAACSNGIGAERTMEHFWNLLIRPMEEIFTTVRSGPYKLFSHKPLRFAEMIQNLKELWVYSQLSDETIRAGHMEPTSDIQDVVDMWIREKKDVKILVVEGANKLAIRCDEQD